VDVNIQITKPSKQSLSNLRNENFAEKERDTSSVTSRMMAAATSFRQLTVYMI
jgi:hypothetical protein